MDERGYHWIDGSGSTVILSTGDTEDNWGVYRERDGVRVRLRSVEESKSKAVVKHRMMGLAKKHGWWFQPPLAELTTTEEPVSKNKKQKPQQKPTAKLKVSAVVEKMEKKMLDDAVGRGREAALEKANIAKSADDRARETALAPFVENLPTTREGLIDHVRMHCRQVAVGSFEAGRAILVLREKEMMSWTEISEQIGLSAEWSMRLAEVARRFAATPQLRAGIKGFGKMLALDIPKDELAEAEKSGTLLGKPMDEIDRMTLREVKALVLKQRTRADEAKAQVTDLRGQVTELKEKLERRATATDDDEVNELINDSQKKFRSAISAFEVASKMRLPKCSLVVRRRFATTLTSLQVEIEALSEQAHQWWDGNLPVDEETLATMNAASPIAVEGEVVPTESN